MNKSEIDVGQVWCVNDEDDASNWKVGVIAKTRPMLVIAVHGNSCNCVPITSSSKSKEYNKIYHELPNKDVLLITQIKTVSKVDFKYYMYSIDSKEQLDINLEIASMFMNPASNWKKAVSKKQEYLQEHAIRPRSPTDKRIPNKVRQMIIRDYSEMPMTQLLKKYHGYDLSKQDVYLIMTGQN